MKVLYVSDSLGTPIHPRGIFNFSVSLVEILKSLGATVDLVVEGADEFGLEGRYGALSKSAPDAVNAIRLSEIHRYFTESRFGFRWGFHSAYARFFAARGRRLVNVWLALKDRLGRPNVVVQNGAERIDFTPKTNEHLNLFNALVLKRGFYSASMSRANFGFSPVRIDAKGYDAVIVDTPHYIDVGGVAPHRILTVVHDLIPLRDPTMAANWRNLFMRKLEASLAMRGNLVFVSRYTQRAFRTAFPRHEAPKEFIFHPAIRKKFLKDAEEGFVEAAGADFAPEPVGPAFASAAGPPALFETASALAFRARPSKPHRKIQPSYGGYSPPPGWNPALPFFVTATSDEPRKNIGLIVRGFYEELRGRANVVVLGEVNSNRYNPGADANVYFPGYVTDAEKVRYFKSARGVLFASLAEGFGIPLIEGAVLELPVICSDIEVFREVAEADAFYFDPHDSRSLAAAVREVLAKPEGARRRAAELRRTVLARFSQEAVGANVQAAFDQLGIVEKVSAVGVERQRFRSGTRSSSALLGEGGGRI